MPEKTRQRRAISLLHRAAVALARALTRKKVEKPASVPAGNGKSERKGPPARQPRPIRREPDVSMAALDQTYSPTQTSLKGPFRASGADHARDQEFAGGFSDERWNDEDRYTNKSGDPRIGTHKRTYEPGEKEK